MAAIISQHLAQVVTTSWGQCEQLEGQQSATSENTLFEEAATQGMTIVSASGDDGSEDCFPTPPTLQVDDPGEPAVRDRGRRHEPDHERDRRRPRRARPCGTTAPSVGASGGGVSSFWPMPSYQSGAPASLHVINGNSSGSQCNASSGDCREVPDVSADGDPGTGYVIYWNGQRRRRGIPPPTRDGRSSAARARRRRRGRR